MKRPLLVFLAVVSMFFVLYLVAPRGTDAAPASKVRPAQGVAEAQPGVVKFSPKMSASALAARPDSDIVEFSDGRRVKMGDIRRLKETAKRLRAAAPGSKLPKAFRTKPAATGIPLADAADLSAALKRPDGDTVVLPSGRRVTVGMIRQFQPQVEKKLGRSLAAGAKPANLSGKAIKVDKQTDWKAILAKPDGTVLEAPDGSRITVRELRQALAAAPPARRSPPEKR